MTALTTTAFATANGARFSAAWGEWASCDGDCFPVFWFDRGRLRLLRNGRPPANADRHARVAAMLAAA